MKTNLVMRKGIANNCGFYISAATMTTYNETEDSYED